MRDTITVAGVAVLSFLLLAASAVVVLNFTRGGQLDRDPSVLSQSYPTVKVKYGDPRQLMSQTVRLYEYGVTPVIALITGVLVGLFTKRRSELLGCVAILPLAGFMLAAHSFAIRGFVLGAVYLILAATAASVSHRLRGSPTAVQATR